MVIIVVIVVVVIIVVLVAVVVVRLLVAAFSTSPSLSGATVFIAHVRLHGGGGKALKYLAAAPIRSHQSCWGLLLQD